MRFITRLLLAGAAAAAALVPPRAAEACGGCFHPEEQTAEQASVVTSHRMALSISPTQTVLWDQVQYAGSPAEFAWVLPVKPGAWLELASDAWFEALDAATQTQVVAPQLACPTPEVDARMGCGGPAAGAGCASEEAVGAGEGRVDEPPAGPDPVTVVHQGSVGPYETVTLHSDVPGALSDWLLDNGFRIEDDIAPILAAYVADGFDFIALRLAPAQAVQQMKPVRVVQQGAVPTLPLRMVAAGTGANVALTLFVVTEGRWQTDNFPSVEIDPALVQWDFLSQSSSYAELRASLMLSEGGRAWLTAYAQPGALLSPVPSPTTGGATVYAVGGLGTTTVAAAFVEQALRNGEGVGRTCLAAAAAMAQSLDRVVDLCPPWLEGDCVDLEPGQIDGAALECEGARGVALDDLGVALTGLHPRDVWLTRLEANLPRAALSEDLMLMPAASKPVSGWVTAGDALNEPCPLASELGVAASPLRRSAGLSLVGLMLVLASTVRRALGRRRQG